jgi:hypothetical protein
MRLSKIVLVTDNPSLAASISSGLAEAGAYFPVLEGPRMLRSDADNEIIRVANAIHSLQPHLIIYGDLSEDISSQISEIINVPFQHVNSGDDLSEYADIKIPSQISPQLAAAEFFRNTRGTGSAKKVVICEFRPDDSTSVIAANYAIAHNADFFLVNVPSDIKKKAIAKLNSISGTVHTSIRQIDINALVEILKEFLPDIEWSNYEQAVYITDELPLGLCNPELPAVHTYIVNVGQQIVRNIYDANYALGNRDGVFGLFCQNTDKDFDTKKERQAADSALLKTGGIFRSMTTSNAALNDLMLETIPYDVLYVATHGGQVRGIENIYLIEVEGISHEVLIHESEDKTTYSVFEIVAVDGEKADDTGWTDAHSKVRGRTWELLSDGKLPAADRTNGMVDMQRRELTLGPGSGAGSAGAFHGIASGYRPMVIVNACGSWTDISARFIFGGASIYIGTYWSVSHGTAIKFAEEFFKHLFDVDVYEAFERARNALSDQDKLAYVISGTLENRFGPGGPYTRDAFTSLKARVDTLIAKQGAKLAEPQKVPEESLKYIDRAVWYLKRFRAELKNVERKLKKRRNGKS